MNNKQEGFGTFEGLLVIVIISLIGVISLYIMQLRTKDAKTQTYSEAASSVKPISQGSSSGNNYLEVKEWGVKIPLSVPINKATYKFATPTSLQLISRITDDSEGVCDTQANFYKVTEPLTFAQDHNLSLEELKPIGSYVGEVYYTFIGTQSACTADEQIQIKADAIRQAWLSQRTSVVAQD